MDLRALRLGRACGRYLRRRAAASLPARPGARAAPDLSVSVSAELPALHPAAGGDGAGRGLGGMDGGNARAVPGRRLAARGRVGGAGAGGAGAGGDELPGLRPERAADGGPAAGRAAAAAGTAGAGRNRLRPADLQAAIRRAGAGRAGGGGAVALPGGRDACDRRAGGRERARLRLEPVGRVAGLSADACRLPGQRDGGLPAADPAGRAAGRGVRPGHRARGAAGRAGAVGAGGVVGVPRPPDAGAGDPGGGDLRRHALRVHLRPAGADDGPGGPAGGAAGKRVAAGRRRDHGARPAHPADHDAVHPLLLAARPGAGRAAGAGPCPSPAAR